MKSKFRKILQLVLTLVMVASFSLCFACKDDEEKPATKSYEFTLAVGNTKMLDFYGVSEGAHYEISVSDESVISVDKLSGVVNALKVGSSVITQTYSGDKTATYAFTIVDSNYVPGTDIEEGDGQQDLDIAIPFLKTTVGGISNVSSVLKFVKSENLTWSVEDGGSAIIKITPSSDKSTCMIEGLAVGKTKVYLSNGIIKDVLEVEVSDPRDTHLNDTNKHNDIQFNYQSIEIKVDTFSSLEIVKLSSNLNVDNVVWTNSNSDVVNLDFTQGSRSAFLTGLAVGEATIRVQIGDFYDECIVTVASNALEKLGTVNLTLTDNVLSWNEVANASGYEYSLDGFRWEDVSNSSNCEHVIDPDIDAGKYNVMVRAKGDGITYRSGDPASKEFISTLYSNLNSATTTFSWYLVPGEDTYTVHVGDQSKVFTATEYDVDGRVASISLNENELSVTRNEDVYVATANREGNVVNYIANDLGLVIVYSGVGNSNINTTFKTSDKVLSVKVDGVEKPFVQEDGKVFVTDYTGVSFGDKIPFDVELENETINSKIVIVPRVLYAGDTNYVSPEANFVNNENTNYYVKYKDIVKVAEHKYELVANDASEFSFTVSGVTITRDVYDLVAKGMGATETVFVRNNENSVEKVKIGVATAFIEDGDQLANLTYVANPYGTWKARTCHVCGTSWSMSNDVVVDGVPVCQHVCTESCTHAGHETDKKCNTPWDASKDAKFGKIFTYGNNELFALKDDIDYFGQKAVYEAETFSTRFSEDGAYNGWGFNATIDGNGYSVYNASERLFVLMGYLSSINNLGVYGNISSSNLFAKHNYNGKMNNCYFDIKVTDLASTSINAIAEFYVTHEESTNPETGVVTPRDNTPVFKNSFVNVTVDPDCTQTVYAIGNNVYGADFSQTYVSSNVPAYNTSLNAPEVAPNEIGTDVSESEIKAFLAQPGINHGAFINDNGVLKFKYTRPDEITLDLIYPLYKFNETYNGRVANTENLAVEGYEDIDASNFLTVAPGTIVPILLENTKEKIVTANVRVVTGAISNANEFANMIYLSVDTVPSPNWIGWGGYYVLTNNIDMQGKTMRKCGRPGTLFNAPGWGFKGTIDGAGYTVFNLNDTMFYQLGDWSATLKDLSLINMTKPLATTLGGFTIDNCYFDFVIDALHTDGAEFTHVLGDSVGDNYGRTGVIKNSVIKVTNNTETKINLINKINAADAGKTNSLTYTNTILVADSAKVGTDAGEIESKPIVLAPNTKYNGDVSGFVDSIWYKEGNYPTFNSFVQMGKVEKTFAYGRYILDRDNGNTAKVNDQDFVATLDTAVTLTVDKSIFNIGSDGMNATPGLSKWLNLMVKGSDGRYYLVDIEFVHFAVNDAVDAANIAKGLYQSNWATGFGAGAIVMFNNDIDMTGVTVVNGEAGGSSYAGDWGYKGTIDGNGYTISNLAQPLITYTNSACVIKDLTFKNMQAGAAVAYKSSGMQLVNVTFDIDASGMTELYLLNKTYLSRTATVLTDCTIKISNASSSFVCYVDYGPNPSYDKGTITLNNVSLTMNAGSFKLAKSEASTGDLTGAQNNTVVNAVLDKTV